MSKGAAIVRMIDGQVTVIGQVVERFDDHVTVWVDDTSEKGFFVGAVGDKGRKLSLRADLGPLNFGSFTA